MRFAAYAVFMVCLCAVFYMLGMNTPIFSIAGLAVGEDEGDAQVVMLNCPESATGYNTDEPCGDTLFNFLILSFGVMISIVALAFVSGQAAIYIVPLIFVYVIINFFVFPFGSILSYGAMPGEIQILLVALFNTITLLGILSFIRGNV